MPLRPHRFIALLVAVTLASLSGCDCGSPPPPNPPALVEAALADGTAGHTYSATLSATDGTPPYSFAAQGIPSGLALATGGALQGIPTGGGDFSIQVTVTDANGETDSATFPLKVFPALAFSTTTLPSATTGTAYSATVGVTGGKPPVVVRLGSGTLPAGTALTGGALSGTPTASGIASLTLTADDANGASASIDLSLDVRDPVTVSTASLADGYAGRAYGATLAVAGGAVPYTWSIASGALPSGLALAGNGAISGMPSAPGNASVTVQVSDRDGRTATQVLALAVFAPTEITASPCPDGYLTEAYSAQWSITGGKAPLSWTVSAGALPGGLALGSATGAIAGIPAAAGPASADVTVTDANGISDTRTCALGVYALPAIATATPLPDLTAGAAASGTFAATGGKSPLSWAVSGALPTGLSLDASSGAYMGTVDAASSNGQTWTFDVLVTDANGRQSTQTFSQTAWRMPVIDTTSLADGYAGRSYGATLAVTGGAAPYTWSVASGALPSGLTLAAGGSISGTPGAPVTASVTVTVTDRGGRSAMQPLALAVFAPTTIAASPCPDGYLTEAYSAQWSATGGKAPLSWMVSAGSLPGGISLGSATGAISGTPAATGPASADLTVTDANGVSDTRTCSLGVYAFPAIATASPLPDLTAGATATGTFAATGGKSPLSWTSTGALPTGLALNASSGAYTGTVDAAATNGQTWSFAVFVTDANGRQSSRTFAATAWRTPVIDTTSLANATEYAPYAPTTIQAHDGKAPLSFAISGLPSGFSTDAASGLLSGTPPPLSRGTYPLTVTVTDAGGRTTTTASPSLVVLPGTPTVTSASPDFGTVAGGTRVTITGTNFFGATVTMGGQPAAATVSGGGTTLDFTTPAGSGQGPITISLTNDSDLSAGANYTYTLERTIDPDGSSADWTPAFQVGVNPAPSNWPNTDLQALYAAYDADNFYVGVAGTLDPSTGNTLILYVDADPGTGSGVSDYSTLQDNNGELDNACTNDGTGTGQWVRANAIFAPDFCTGTKNLTTVPLAAGWPFNDLGGLRGLNVVTDYPWIVDYQGHNLVAIASSQANGFTEFLIPWKALYPSTGAPPISHASVALVARIVDATGNLIADQTLPQDNDANPRRLSQVAEVDVRVTPPSATAAPWYQGSVFYTTLVRSFQDSTGDGHGDLAGLRSRLDYLNDGNPATTTDLGVDALWLMPIFQSPSYHGYDATNYDLVQPAYGTLADFQALTDAAHQRGMKVYLDLALNHTSDQHPWFIDSASSPGSAHRDWYVWSPADLGWTQPWSADPVWHPRNGAWYYGLFFTALPDLNYRTPAVRDEMKRVAAQWVQRGADGYRLDATPYLIEDGPGAGQQHTPGTHQYLKEIRDHVATFNPNAAVVAENWTDTETIARYYGKRTIRGGDEVQMSFDFPLADRIIESLFTQNAIAVASKLVEQRAAYPFGAVDAPFLTNHDQDRIATTLGNDPQRLGLAAAILLTVPGAPFIYYGEELGAQDSTTPGDESRRAPMAWDATPGAGFTAGVPWSPLPPGTATANVASQTGDPASLLSRYRQLIRTRKTSPALAAGQGLEMLTPVFGFDPMLVFVRTDGAERVVVAHNLSSVASATTCPLRAGSLQPLFIDPGATASGAPGSWTVSLPPYGSAVWREQP